MFQDAWILKVKWPNQSFAKRVTGDMKRYLLPGTFNVNSSGIVTIQGNGHQALRTLIGLVKKARGRIRSMDMSKLSKTVEDIKKEDVKLDVARSIEDAIKKNGFPSVLQGFIFALDKKDSKQSKVIDLLTREAIF